MSRQRMAPGDAAWLHMDRRTNRLIVNSVMWFDEPLDWDEVRDLLRERLIGRFPRFSQRVVDHATSVWWEDDEDFELDDHLLRASLPEPGGVAELQRYVSECASQPLLRNRPLWELHFVDGFRGHGCAVVSRIHHCIADGVALSRVMLSLTDDPIEAAQANVATHDGAADSALGRVRRVVAEVIGDVIHPPLVVGHAHTAVSAARAIARLLTLPPDAHTCLRGRLGEDKTLVWSEPIPLPDLSATAHAARVTVNDLLLSAVSGALRSHLARHDGCVPDIRAVVPINLRPPGTPLPAELGNDFGLLYLQLPTSVDNPQVRLAELHRRTEALKHSAEPVVSLQILGLTGHTPYDAQQVFVDLFAAKASAVMTNVPGPAHPVYLAGRQVRGTIGWPPESGNLGLGVSIISYDGEVIVGVMADDQLINEPERILNDIGHELALLTGPYLPSNVLAGSRPAAPWR
jgi:diacylglycerol O-acyltransferase / wax synthase